MARPPRPPHQHILGAGVWQRVLLLGVVVAAASLGAALGPRRRTPLAERPVPVRHGPAPQARDLMRRARPRARRADTGDRSGGARWGTPGSGPGPVGPRGRRRARLAWEQDPVAAGPRRSHDIRKPPGRTPIRRPRRRRP
ncbi:hypothetical protein ABTY61_36790 [Kitasatospora sp. NPDC096128]|uniref:hypothetical protein n=1 Tax=Kitasatospora sp. NPDC096128 TaxID=3155547 RepID=UPI003317C040